MAVEISVSDLGPIRSASFTLKPLTVFVGPNNSGKSVLATVAYAALEKNPALSWISMRARLRRRSGLTSPLADSGAPQVEEHADWLTELLGKGSTHLSDKPIPPAVESVLQDNVDRELSAYSQAFSMELERCFGTKLSALRRAHGGPARTRIKVSSTLPRWQFTISITARKNVISWQERPDLESLVRRYLRTMSRLERNEYRRLTPEGGFELLAAGTIRACFRSLPRRSWYLPAARSGILQSQKVLAGTLIRASSLAGITDIQVPALSGVVTDFLNEMITISDRGDTDFEHQAASLERRLLGGKIEVAAVASAAPEFLYRTSMAEFPLHRTSSMVSEVAPIVLYLRHVLQRGDVLMVEEPEAHLHPASQIALAEVLAELVNGGLQVFLTTHSEFFLQQLSNLIVASQVTEEAAREVGIDPRKTIPPDKVGAYIFTTDDDRLGTMVSELEVSANSGLSEASFIGVAEALYNQSVKLDREISE